MRDLFAEVKQSSLAHSRASVLVLQSPNCDVALHLEVLFFLFAQWQNVLPEELVYLPKVLWSDLEPRRGHMDLCDWHAFPEVLLDALFKADDSL